MKLKKFSYKKVISTNSTAIRLIRVGKSSGFVTSEIQSKGRGQRGNKWISKYGNIFISILIPLLIKKVQAPGYGSKPLI